MKEENVILVDSHDTPVGQMEKMDAHLKGELHRALSVLIFNSKGEVLLQQRAFSKYHTPGLWSNTACSHPRPDEDNLEAATRRLGEEMGFTTVLNESFDFVYKAHFDNGLIEHEFDHVFFGTFDGIPVINPEEANDFKWVKPSVLMEDMRSAPEDYTVWFRIIMEKMEERFPELFA
ncbi:MAG: isopentenyl-diphosphate Delta-isomerase [Lentimicrobiaceae bacterium]|jgi:isopentenyl-diphosphate delta-isomerase